MSAPGNQEFVVTELVQTETPCVRILRMKTIYVSESPGLENLFIFTTGIIYMFTHYLVGIPYESYKGFHEWRYKVSEIKYTMKYLLDIFKEVPGLVEALGKEQSLDIYGSRILR